MESCEDEPREDNVEENTNAVTVVVTDGFGSKDRRLSLSCDCKRKSKRVFYRPNGLPHVRSQSENVFLHRSVSPQEVRRIRERLLRTHYHIRATGFSQFDKSQKLVFTSLALVDFISFCSMSIMAPFFPKEAAAKGMSSTVSGLVFSFYAFVMFVSSPLFGKILPLVGAKFMFMSGMFVAGGCSIIFGLLDKITDYMTFAVYSFLLRGTEALGAAAYSTASYTFVADVFPDHIGPVMGILETFVGLGMSAGPALGGVLYAAGGFGLPFYTLGVVMVLFVPINLFLLPPAETGAIQPKSGSIMAVLRVPSVIIIGLVVIVSANNWGFLDPTLEPHLRQFHLGAQQVGLVFLLSSAVYAAASPLWGLLANKVGSHWLMMFLGLLLCTAGLLTIGPSPLLPFLSSSLWLTLVSLSILGVAAALALLPTYQAVLDAAVAGGCSDELSTYSIVAGVWSGMYSLGEVIGPSLGGLILERFGFPICSTAMAGLTLLLAIIVFIFFTINGQPTKIDKDGFVDIKEEDETDDEVGTEGSPLLSERLAHYASMHNSTYGTLEEARSNTNSNLLKTVALTATGAVEV